MNALAMRSRSALALIDQGVVVLGRWMDPAQLGIHTHTLNLLPGSAASVALALGALALLVLAASPDLSRMAAALAVAGSFALLRKVARRHASANLEVEMPFLLDPVVRDHVAGARHE